MAHRFAARASATSIVLATLALTAASAQAADDRTAIFNASGKRMGAFPSQRMRDECSMYVLQEGRVWVAYESNLVLTYARPVSKNQWRAASIGYGGTFHHIGTITRVLASRWRVRTNKGRVLGFTQGPWPVPAGLALLTFPNDCLRLSLRD